MLSIFTGFHQYLRIQFRKIFLTKIPNQLVNEIEN